MKIKVTPKDFCVKELADFSVGNHGDYNVYLLEKQFWNTLDAINFLAKQNNLQVSQFSYGGKKDRYADTTQYITVYRGFLNKVTGNENLRLKYLGKSKEPFKPSCIKANEFSIVIRDLSEEEVNKLKINFENRLKYGFPNYFGEQRFGSYDSRLGFFAEKFLKAQYNGAVKAVYCSIYPEDKSDVKDKKKKFFEHWGDFKYCLRLAKTASERRIFTFLSENPKKFLNAIHLISQQDLSTYFSAYQAHLWNRMLSKFLVAKIKDQTIINIKGWKFLSYHLVDSNTLEYLKQVALPTHGLNPYFMSDEVERCYDEILREEGLHQGKFNFRHYRKVIMKSFLRNAIVFPDKIKDSVIDNDELYKNKFKIVLTFKLPRGAFATMLIKHL